MSKEEAILKAEELARKYNPEGISPFPFEKILADHKDLDIHKLPLESTISGLIIFSKKVDRFSILVNSSKPLRRQYFTTAHELGHYFLHKDVIEKESAIVDGDYSLDGESILYRSDFGLSTRTEIEANNFAASLIMPKDLVRAAWKIFKDPQKCADLFKVSLSAMSIRLEHLNLVNVR